MRVHKVCLECGKELNGRIDKKFCDMYCKGSYHFKKSKEEQPKFYSKVDDQLKRNRKILKEFNKTGISIVRLETLRNLGFNTRFFTHFWKDKKGDTYLFCYEYGIWEKTDRKARKHVVVEWKDYMEN
ncbi:MAG: hypothetical protein KAS71_15020 [Bacteroidales bacterium]|nr:hypothetical protein [Bacteroidales bacterium]